jgi:hypothetical protein
MGSNRQALLSLGEIKRVGVPSALMSIPEPGEAPNRQQTAPALPGQKTLNLILKRGLPWPKIPFKSFWASYLFIHNDSKKPFLPNFTAGIPVVSAKANSSNFSSSTLRLKKIGKEEVGCNREKSCQAQGRFANSTALVKAPSISGKWVISGTTWIY